MVECISALVRRRGVRTTTTILIPSFLLILTGVAILFLPSSYYHDLLRLGGGVGINDTCMIDSETNANGLTTLTAEKTAIKRSLTTRAPKELLDLGVYDSKDFVNEKGISPTGWEDSINDPTIWGPCRFRPMNPSSSFSITDVEWTDRRRRFPTKSKSVKNKNSSNNKTDATTNNSTRSDEYYRNADLEDFVYRKTLLKSNIRIDASNKNKKINDNHSKGGWCRPGFLIIGAGKCGTSSLYHYLMGHPRVVPAVEKQIHYFKYYAKTKPLEWYYGHFPTPQSFLEHGALTTGEASPGYLPYPDVPKIVYQTYGGTRNGALFFDKHSHAHQSEAPTVPPRIIALGREPMDRMYSSYRYNYVVPTIEHMRTFGHPHLPKRRHGNSHQHQKQKKTNSDTETEIVVELHHPDDEYYMPYLFTLEDFVRAELKQLRGCFYDWGPKKTYATWHRDSTYKEAIEVRNGPYVDNINNVTAGAGADLPSPLIDLDGVCYGSSVSHKVYREQWTEMQTNNPENKVLLKSNLHLTQALIGRSLYFFPLEWWYLNLDIQQDQDQQQHEKPIFVCTEELKDVNTLHHLTDRLGLPKFDGFDGVLAEGAYNAGGHRGYDTATSWEEIELEKKGKEQHEYGTNVNASNNTNTHTAETKKKSESSTTNNDSPMTNGIPLPEDLYRELKEFIDPLNERLFALTGKRCKW
mmetsp:Transcript_18559/g.39014  ORF Transcript_18559/g.39014 Transcript_18559/m.39014 type:complete len:692 (+) Transcript_18559:434-2509(+)